MSAPGGRASENRDVDPGGIRQEALSPHELRYSIYCASCGALNYLNSRKDYHGANCAECGSSFRIPAKPHSKTGRKIARGVSAAVFAVVVVAACVWTLFFRGGGSNFQAPDSRRFPVPQVESSRAPAAGEVRKFPVPPAASLTPQKSALPAPDVIPGVAPPKAAKAEKIAPNETRTNFNERYDKLIERVLREKSPSHREKTDDLLEIPFPGSADERR